VRARALEKLLERWVRISDSSPPRPRSERPGAGVNHPSPSAPEPPEPLADAALAALELDPTVRRSPRLIELFIEQSPPLIEAIRAAADAGKHEDVRKLAHKLKGNCLSLGVVWMAHASSAIEQAASQGQIDVVTVGRLPAMMVAARDRLDAPSAAPVAHKDGT
jgi:HPt (histidine-containing phosphotransfer) domain-containing protein